MGERAGAATVSALPKRALADADRRPQEGVGLVEHPDPHAAVVEIMVEPGKTTSSTRLPAALSRVSISRDSATRTLLSSSPWNISTGALIRAALRAGDPSSMCGPSPI